MFKLELGKRIEVMLEKMGARCRNCGTWGDSNITTEDKLEWSVNCGNALFSDPFYVKITRRHCVFCGHLMSEKRGRSGKEVT